jgi:hypothetical protein
VKPTSIDEWWAELTAEYAAQKREVPREDTRWYEQQLRHMQERLAIAVHARERNERGAG